MKNEISKYQSYLSKPKQEEHVVVYKTEDDIMQDKVNDLFPGKWKAVSIVIEDMEQDLNSKEIFEFDAEKNKNCLYTSNGKTQKGKWAYRPKSSYNFV